MIDLLSVLLPLSCEGDRPALLLRDGPRSRSWFQKAALSLAAELVRCGTRRCLLALSDEARMAVAFAAAARAGCEILLPANLASGHLKALAATADMVFSDQADLGGRDPLSPCADAEALPPAVLDGDHVFVTFHTSGSTNGPVPVTRPLIRLATEVATLEATFIRDAADPALVAGSVPCHHIYGFLFRLVWPLAAGRTIVTGLLLHPHELCQAVEREGGTVFVSSPTFLKRAQPALDLAALGPGLIAAFSSGGPLDPAVAAAWNNQTRASLFEVFGSTETGGIAYRRVSDPSRPSRWTPFLGVHVRRDGETGQLRLNSPHQACAGEMVCADVIDGPAADGSFRLLGRADRIVKIDEVRVSLNEVEQALSVMAGVQEVRVFPLSRSRRTALAAVVVPSSDGWTDLCERGRRTIIAAMAKDLREVLPRSAVPRYWRFVRTLPENSQGKITTEQLEALFQPACGHVTRPETLSVSRGEDTIAARLRVPPSLCYFDGHFDGTPILPGVAQLGWAVTMAMADGGKGGAVLRVEALKFFRVVRPAAELDLVLSFKPDSDKVQFDISSSSGRHASGRLLFGGEGGGEA